MSEVPKNDGTTGPDELHPSLGLHTSPSATKICLQSKLNLSASLSINSFAAKDSSGDEGVALAEEEQSIRLDPLVDDGFSSSSTGKDFFELGTTDSSTLDKSVSQDLSAIKLQKRRRRTMTPDELSNSNSQNKEQKQVFKKTFRKTGGKVKPLKPLSESEEENECPVEPYKDPDVELASSGNLLKDPYVLNINVVVPKDYTQRNIPINVNIIDSSNNSSAESIKSRRDSSVASTTTQGFMDNIEDVRNSTFISESGETEEHSQLVPIGQNTNFESENLQHVTKSDEISLQGNEIHLSETLPVAVKTEPLDTTNEVHKPGPSKSSTSKPRNTTKRAQPNKTNLIKDPVKKKDSSNKTLPGPKPKSNAKKNKETTTKKEAKEETKKRNATKKEEAIKTNKGADEKGETKKGAAKQVDAKKQLKEKSKKGCEQGGDKKIEKGKKKVKQRHGKVKKKTKRKSCQEARCKHCHQQSSSDSECSICSGKYCGRSSTSSDDDDSTSSSSDSSSCSCSSCQDSSSSSD